ncbi:unnamed protein product [Durusdinium trenchii]|uniref:Uncharacterized protein n=1 Tax=Durusdinium trenchii TaxID=1381693 RepID=A0ABP0RJV9_9DINO
MDRTKKFPQTYTGSGLVVGSTDGANRTWLWPCPQTVAKNRRSFLLDCQPMCLFSARCLPLVDRSCERRPSEPQGGQARLASVNIGIEPPNDQLNKEPVDHSLCEFFVIAHWRCVSFTCHPSCLVCSSYSSVCSDPWTL